MRFLLKSLRWLLLILLLLLLLAAGAAYYLLGTQSGYRQLPALVNRFTPYTLTYDSLEGRFWGRQEWRNLHLSGPDGLDWRADTLIADFAAADLRRKRLHFPQLELGNSVLSLPSSGGRPPSAASPPLTQLPQIDLPLIIDIDKLRVQELRIEQADAEILTIHEVNGSLHGKGSDVQLEVQTALSQGKGKDAAAEAAFAAEVQLAGNISLSGAYPLALKGNSTLQLPGQPAQHLEVSVGGSALSPEMQVQAQGWLDAQLGGNAAIDLAGQSLTAALHWQAVRLPMQEIEIADGGVELSGPFSDMRFSLNGGVQGKDIPAATLAGSGRLSAQALRDLDVSVNTLGGSIALQGFAEFGEALNWQADLRVQDIDARRYDPAIDAVLNAHLHTEGRQSAGQPLQAALEIARLEGRWQQHPVSGSGDIALAGEELAIHDLQLDLAGNKVALTGGADARAVDIHADIDAAALSRLLPMLEGAVKGKLHLSGAPHNPEIAADLQWRDLQMRQDGAVLFASKNGALQSSGSLQDLRIALQGEAQGRDFPPLKLSGTAQMLASARLENIEIAADTMGGKVDLRGRLEFSPQLHWEAEADVRQVRPDFYLPDMAAQIGGKLQAEGGIDAQGNLNTRAQLRDLNGTWQGQKLAGALQAEIDGGNVALREMDVQVGDNRLSGQAQLQGQKLQGEIAVQALNLAQLHPQLRGVLRGTLAAGGSAQAPELKADLKGENLAFADSRAAAAEIVLDAGMQAGAAFNNRILLTGVEAGGQQWSAVRLETQGQYQQHNLSLTTEGGEYNALLQAAGGFTAIDAWAGSLKQLEAQLQDLRWQLRRPSEVAVSPRAITLRDACLADQYSALCLSLSHQEHTSIEYAIEQIDPRSVAPFMPENLKLDTLLTGEGKLTLAGSSIRGNADLRLSPGKITATVKGQPPIVLQLKEATLQTQFSEQRSRSLLSVDFADTGTLRADIGIRDFANPQLSGKLHLSLPDIGRFQHFVPQVSDLKGSVQGNMVFSGPLSAPQASGEILLDKGALKVPEYATELKNIRLRLSARRDGNIDIDGNIGTPKGSLQADGVLRLQPLTLNLQLKGREMLLADAKTMRLLASPDFDIRIDPDSGVIIKGDILIPEAAVSIPDTRNAVGISEDVVIVNNATPTDDAPYIEPADSPVQADIGVRLGDKVFFRDPNMNIRLMGGIDIVMRPGMPLRGRGRIEVASGYYELYGQELNIKRGWVTFSDELANPSIDIIAMREVDDVEAGAQLSGTVKRMRLDLISDPAMPDSAVLSYLIFGRPPDSATDSTALLQTAAVVGTKGLFPDDLASQTGLDVFDLGVGGLKAGKYLMEDLYVGIKSNFFTGVTQFLGRYRLTDRLSIEASSSSLDGNAVDMIYEFETD